MCGDELETVDRCCNGCLPLIGLKAASALKHESRKRGTNLKARMYTNSCKEDKGNRDDLSTPGSEIKDRHHHNVRKSACLAEQSGGL